MEFFFAVKKWWNCAAFYKFTLYKREIKDKDNKSIWQVYIHEDKYMKLSNKDDAVKNRANIKAREFY